MRALPKKSIAAITLVEMLMYCILAVAIGGVIYNTMRAGSSLAAKNASVNRSHDELRSAMDRLANNLRMSRNVPTLITTTGAVATGNAAGLRYDRILGEPYAIDPVMAAGSLSPTATSMVVYRSVAAVGSPPIPTVGDILLVDTPDGAIRVRITSVSANAVSGNTQKITMNFASQLGQSLTWKANQPQWARLVRQEAFIVMPNSKGFNELRYYKSFDPMPSLTDKSKYAVITDQLSNASGDATPFSVATVDGDKIVQANLKMEVRDYNRWMANRQANQMNTYFRMNMSMASRLRPKNTN